MSRPLKGRLGVREAQDIVDYCARHGRWYGVNRLM